MAETASNTSILSPAEMARYSRHVILPQVGVEGQERLSGSRVLVIGMGGLGSPVALYLSAAGVGTLGLADFDEVEEHNLQRQIIHQTVRVGAPKIDSAREQIHALNPHTAVEQHRAGLTIENATELFSQYDLVIDGTDNFGTRYLVNDAAFFTQTPVVYGSIFQFEGQVTLIAPHEDGPCYRCLFPRMPEPGAVPNCAEAGVFGALCGVIGSLQSMEALKYLMGIGEPLKGRLLTVDALTMTMRTLKIRKAPDCPLCGGRPSITALEAGNYEFSCETEEPEPEPETGEFPMEVSVQEAQEMLEQASPPLLVDVREPYEVAICSIPSHVSIPLRQFPDRSGELPADRRILVYCHHGIRSLNATKFLRAKGLEKASSIAGGIDAWSRQIDPGVPLY